MFKWLGRNRQAEADNRLYAPVSGTLIDITQVEDPVFSGKMMGEGFGIVPDDGNLVSPVAGQVTMVANTKHAIGLKMVNGLEILVHLGIDTVELKGAPFALDVKTGDIVRGGDKLGTIDLEKIKQAGKDNTVIVVVTNSNEALKAIHAREGDTAAGQTVGQLEPK